MSWSSKCWMLPPCVPSTIEFKGKKFFSVIQTKCWCTKAWKYCFAKKALLQHLGATLRGTSCNAWCPLGEEEACRGGGRGWFSEMFLRNGSQKCFSETVLEMFLRNGSQKGQMGLQRHRWQERQRIKKGQAGPLKHSLSMKWENKETKQFLFEVFANACLILGELYHILGELYFPHLEIRSGGNDSRLILITIVPPDYHSFPGYSATSTDSLQSKSCPIRSTRVKLFLIISFSRKIADAPSWRECSTSSPIWPGSCSCWWKKFLAWKTWVCRVEGEKLPPWRGWAELGWCGLWRVAQKKLPVWKRLTVSRGQDVKQ